MTLALSTISPFSVMVCWDTMPCGATSACGRWNAKLGGRGRDHPCLILDVMLLKKLMWFVFTYLWFPYSRAAARSLRREESEIG